VKVKDVLKKIPAIAWGILAVILIFIFFADGFMLPRNLFNILGNTSVLMIASVGMTFAILSQQIDISIGGVMSVSGLAAAMFVKGIDEPSVCQVFLAFIIASLIGLAFGVFNGLMIGVLKYNYWLITFATMSIGYGMAEVINNGNVVSGLSKNFRNVADGKFLGIRTVVYVAAAVIIVMCWILYKTRFGMHIYAVGDSEKCAENSGIQVSKIRFAIYSISGLLAGFAGALLAAKTNSAGPIGAEGYEWNAIAATIIGGTSFSGGQGGLAGTVVGAFIMTVIINGLQLLGLSNYWQQVFKGLFILIVIVINVLGDRRKAIESQRRVYKHE
jgi:ribose transport system permease protein